MKKSMFALVAIMVASFASAVTIDWNDDSAWKTATTGSLGNLTGSSQGAWSYSSSSFYNGGADFAVRITYTGDTWTSGAAWSRIFTIQGSGTDASLQLTTPPADGGLWLGWNSVEFNPSVETKVPVGATGATMTFAVVYDHEKSTVEYYISANGSTPELMYTKTGVTIDEAVTLGCNEGSNKVGGVFKGETTYAVEYYSATPIPEPTVLALLALGVGAIALKRKVA